MCRGRCSGNGLDPVSHACRVQMRSNRPELASPHPNPSLLVEIPELGVDLNVVKVFTAHSTFEAVVEVH